MSRRVERPYDEIMTDALRSKNDEGEIGFFEFVEMVNETPPGTGALYIRNCSAEEIDDWLNGDCGYKAHCREWASLCGKFAP
jgi:hypothetical protein